MKLKNVITQNDFAPTPQEAARQLLIQGECDTVLALFPDNPAADAVACIVVDDERTGESVCISLDGDAVKAIRDALNVLILERIEKVCF